MKASSNGTPGDREELAELLAQAKQVKLDTSSLEKELSGKVMSRIQQDSVSQAQPGWLEYWLTDLMFKDLSRGLLFSGLLASANVVWALNSGIDSVATSDGLLLHLLNEPLGYEVLSAIIGTSR